MPPEEHAVPTPAEPEERASEPAHHREAAVRPGPTRLLVAIGDAPARWYRSPAEAVADARALLDTTAPGDLLARAWTEAPADGPPVWELRRSDNRSPAWGRPGDADR